MIVALVALALVVAGLAGANIWAVRRAMSAEDERIKAVIAWVAMQDERDAAIKTRDAAVVELARITDAFDVQLDRSNIADMELKAARRSLADARIASVADAEPGAVGAAIDRVLEQRLAEQVARDAAIAAHGDRPAAAATVPGPGAAATGPEPSWSHADER